MLNVSQAKLAHKFNLIRQKKIGTPITLRWTEWPDGKPTPDPTTGAVPASPEHAPVTRTFSTKVWVYRVSATQTAARKFAEIQVGDMIVDFNARIVRIAEVGDTDFYEGQIMDIYTLNAANRLVENPAIPDDTDVILADLENPSFIVDGQVWVQQTVGKDIPASWAENYAGELLGQVFLLRKGT